MSRSFLPKLMLSVLSGLSAVNTSCELSGRNFGGRYGGVTNLDAASIPRVRALGLEVSLPNGWHQKTDQREIVLTNDSASEIHILKSQEASSGSAMTLLDLETSLVPAGAWEPVAYHEFEGFQTLVTASGEFLEMRWKLVSARGELFEVYAKLFRIDLGIEIGKMILKSMRSPFAGQMLKDEKSQTLALSKTKSVNVDKLCSPAIDDAQCPRPYLVLTREIYKPDAAHTVKIEGPRGTTTLKLPPDETRVFLQTEDNDLNVRFQILPVASVADFDTLDVDLEQVHRSLNEVRSAFQGANHAPFRILPAMTYLVRFTASPDVDMLLKLRLDDESSDLIYQRLAK